MEFVIEPEKKIPVIDKRQVLVVGGGVAGIGAAVAATRLGARAMLLEESASLGGTVTLGLNTNFMGVDLEVNRGIFLEFYEKLKAGDALIEGFHSPIDPEIFKWVALGFMQENAIDLLFHTRVVDVLKEGSRVRGVIVENNSGRQAIMSDVVVDASGDGDVAVMAGEAFEKSKPDEHAMTLLFRVAGADVHKFVEYMRKNRHDFLPTEEPRDIGVVDMDRAKPLVALAGFKGLIKEAREKGELYLTHDSIWIAFLPASGTVLINATHVLGLNPMDAKDLTTAEIECRKQMMSVFAFFKRNVPGFEDVYILDSAARTGIRESRRITGEYILTMDDVTKARKFEDSIATNFMPVDIHGPGEQQTWIKMQTPYSIPYRSLQGKVNDNLLVAGRCISVDHQVQGSIRSVPCCFATGQAAGAGAALAALGGQGPKGIDVGRLREELKKQGAVVAYEGRRV